VSPKGWTDIVDVNEPNAWLANDEGVCWRGNNPVRDIGLKVHYAGACKVEIISPSGDNRVRLDSFVTMLFEKREESLSHLPKAKTLPSGRIVNES
jgi:hypothetical protein